MTEPEPDMPAAESEPPVDGQPAAAPEEPESDAQVPPEPEPETEAVSDQSVPETPTAAPDAPSKHPRPPKQPSKPGPTSVSEVLARLHGTGDSTKPVDGESDVLAQAAEVVDGAGRTVELERLVAERTDDLQRIQAEYANYRKRVERDRALAKQQGVEQVVRELMPILDAISQAEEHEELTGGFKVVAGEFTRVSKALGLTSFGAIGDEFDPNQHEALMQIPAPDVEPGRIAQVIQPGYRIGDDVLRPARVAVAAGAE